MFKSIDISNFRGIRHSRITDFRRINLFFGKNNSGKSTLLEAIFLLSGQSNPTLPITINNTRGYAFFTPDDVSIEFHNLDSSKRIELTAESNPDRKLAISPYRPSEGEIDIKSLTSDSSTNTAMPYGLTLTYTLGDDGTVYHSDIIVSGTGDKQKVNVKIDEKYSEPIICRFNTSDSLDMNLTESFAQIIAAKQESSILEAIRKIDDRITDIHFADGKLLADIGADKRLPVNMLGDGIRKLLAVLTVIINCKDGIALIDEIDNGLHFSSMRILWDAILNTASKYNVQVFATTHNIDSLQGLETVLKEYDEVTTNDISAFKLIRDKKDELHAVRYDYCQFSYAISQALEIR